MPSTAEQGRRWKGLWTAVILGLACLPAWVAARPRQRHTQVHHRRQSADAPCAGLFNNDYYLFPAKTVYDCLVTVPFNKTNALQFLQYYEDTVQLQSTLAYLKDPPADYQQPKFDLIQALEVVRADVNQGKFANEYDFEYTLQQIVLATHDGHIQLAYGILSVFVFGAPYGLVSASHNGLDSPKAYIPDDLIEIANSTATWQPSPVTTINGLDTTKFLETFASMQVPDFIEPHADWNALMSNPAGDIQSLYSVLEGNAMFYPGENITYGFENGTTSDFEDGSKLVWVAEFSLYTDTDAMPNIQTGQQLFDWFILNIDTTPEGQSPASGPNSTIVDEVTPSSAAAITSTTISTDQTAATATVSAVDQPSTTDGSSIPTDQANVLMWDNPAYPPDPIISQPNLGGTDGGYVTGYVLNDNVTGVLSIPSFDMTTGNAITLSTAVRDFLRESLAAGCTRVIIDLQRNTGGSELLAIDTFKQFFPNTDPFHGARQRADNTGDALGNTFTTWFQTQRASTNVTPTYEQSIVSPWVAPVYLNAETNMNFTSWGQLFGPHPSHGDQFTTVQRDNLSSALFDESMAGIVVYGFANNTVNTTQPYPSKDVILLTDALCSSACAQFVEMMRQEGGARTVVAGGRPESGPMQAVGGNKGTQIYSSFDLDTDIYYAGNLNSSVTAQLPQNRDTDFVLSYASINLKDGIRRGLDTPLQFVYEPADCRIYYTTHTVYKFVNLWNYVIDAFYRNPSLCIAGASSTKPASSPTPSSIGDMIMAGLSRPVPPVANGKRSITKAHKKRSLDSREAFGNSAPTLTTGSATLGKDVAGPLDGCPSSCGAGAACVQAPFTRNGQVSYKSTCRQTCNANVPCGGPPTNLCFLSKKFCVANSEAVLFKQLASSTGPDISADTQKPDPSLRTSQFSRGDRLGGTGRSP